MRMHGHKGGEYRMVLRRVRADKGIRTQPYKAACACIGVRIRPLSGRAILPKHTVILRLDDRKYARQLVHRQNNLQHGRSWPCRCDRYEEVLVSVI